VTGRRALSSLRQWGPELVCGGLCLILAGTRQPAGAGAVALVLGIGWWMGHRHRTLPLHRQVREIWETTRRIEDRGLGEEGPGDAAGPLARVLPMRRR
jgi:hypothetical protein